MSQELVRDEWNRSSKTFFLTQIMHDSTPLPTPPCLLSAPRQVTHGSKGIRKQILNCIFFFYTFVFNSLDIQMSSLFNLVLISPSSLCVHVCLCGYVYWWVFVLACVHVCS